VVKAEKKEEKTIVTKGENLNVSVTIVGNRAFIGLVI